MKSLRRYAVAAAALVLVGSLRIISTYRVFSHTIDEPDNLAAGMEYVSTGRYLYHDENPPLARVFSAIGPFLAGERYHPGPNAHLEGARILGTGAHYDRVLALARTGTLPFFWTASVVVFLWALRTGGPAAALIATALFTTLPPILALAGIANTDMALCATVAAAALVSLYWAAEPTPRRTGQGPRPTGGAPRSRVAFWGGRADAPPQRGTRRLHRVGLRLEIHSDSIPGRRLGRHAAVLPGSIPPDSRIAGARRVGAPP